MAIETLVAALRQLTRLFSGGTASGFSDAQLLDRFVIHSDAAAFEALVARHGPMVLRVCRGILDDPSDAEDAFQATFLILVKKARGFHGQAAVGGWLHLVAHRVAVRANVAAARRRANERRVGLMATPSRVSERTARNEQYRTLHEEIVRLPERFRLPIVVCDLQGVPQEQAAIELRLSERTLRRRLREGRERLKARLLRSGLSDAGMGLGVLMRREARADLPKAWAETTVRAALAMLNHSLAAGAISAAALALTEGVTRIMLLHKIGLVSISLVGATLAAWGLSAALLPAGEQAQKQKAAALVPAEKPRDKARKIAVTTVQSRSVPVTERYVCQIRSHHQIEVRAPADGYLEAIAIKEGQAVKRDDVLFRVLPVMHRPAQPQAVPYGGDEKLAAAELKYTNVKAPFGGVVDRVRHQQGSLVNEGETLTTLSDNSLMWVYFNVPESRYLEFKSAKLEQHKDDLKIELELANGNTFNQPGKLGAIAAQFNNNTGNISFRADFPNPEGLLRHGQLGTLLIGRVLNGAIVIPQRATFETLDKRYVFVVDKNDVVHQREIVIQNEWDDLFVVKSGVGAGDKIVTEGVRFVRDGGRVGD